MLRCVCDVQIKDSVEAIHLKSSAMGLFRTIKVPMYAGVYMFTGNDSFFELPAFTLQTQFKVCTILVQSLCYL